MKIAYLMNQYPYTSCTFIRREILSLEACGLSVDRFSIRQTTTELVDIADLQEREKTRIILAVGGVNLIASLLRIAITRPIPWLKALALTLQIGWRSKRGLLRHLAYLAEACVLLGWLVEAEITHIHSHFGTNATTVAMLCNLLGELSYSFTAHGPEEFDFPNELALSEKIRQAAFVVAISSFCRSQLYRWCAHEQWGKIQVIRCGVDENFFNCALTPVPDSPTLVCIGRLCEQKGQLLLIDAAKLLADRGVQFKLVLVGDGELRSEIETLIAQRGLDKQIEITGWASGEAVQQYIRHARATILPSFAEGLPVVIMESLALGRPVISTYVAGIPELVESNICGWLVSPSSVEVLVETMHAVLQMPVEKLETMGKIGAARVAQQHNATVEARKLAALFRASGT